MPVWPDNRQSLVVFLAMRHQWTHGPAGPVGMSHAGLPEVWQRLAVPEADRNDIFMDLLLMQDAALAAMHEGKQ